MSIEELNERYAIVGSGLHQGRIVDLATGDLVGSKEVIRALISEDKFERNAGLEAWIAQARKVPFPLPAR
jgi:hypothetical protein